MTRPPYDVDPRVPDDTWMGLQVERPRSGMVIVYIAAAVLVLGVFVVGYSLFVAVAG